MGYPYENMVRTAVEWAGIAARSALFILLWRRLAGLPCGSSRFAHPPGVCGGTDKPDRSGLLFIILLSVTEIIFQGLALDGFPAWLSGFVMAVLPYAFIRRRDRMPETVFSILLYINLRHLSYFAINSCMDIISDRVMRGIEEAENVESFLAFRVEVMYLGTLVLYLAVMIIEILPILKIIRVPVDLSWHECIYLSVLNAAGIILTRIMMGLSVLKAGEGAFILTDEKPELLWQLPLVAGLLYAGELAAIFIWQRYSIYRQKEEIFLAESIEKEAIRRRLEETERYYEQVRKVRHEMTNHLANISGLAEQGELDELIGYISSLDESIRPIEIKYSTGNPVADVVINDKYRKCREKGISFTAALAYEEVWGIPVYDLSIILCNLLDNAIKAADEADEGNRYVALRETENEGVVLFRCENGYKEGGSIMRSMTSNEPTDGARPAAKRFAGRAITDIKGNPDGKKLPENEWHGIGLKNVRAIAERYDGAVKIKKWEDVFIITVMLRKQA